MQQTLESSQVYALIELNLKVKIEIFYFLTALFYWLCAPCFASGALFISKHNLLHQVTRGSGATWLHTFSALLNREPTTWKFRVSIFFFPFSEWFGTFSWIVLFIFFLWAAGAITPPYSPCSQTSRNETRFCPPDCGGALSAALTCTESTLVKYKQYNWSVDVPRSVGSQLLPNHWKAGGGGAGVPDRGGAHLQPLLCAAGEVRRLLWGRKPRVPSHTNHKCHHAAIENQTVRAGSRIRWNDVCGASDMWM